LKPDSVQRQEVLSVSRTSAGQRLDLYLVQYLDGVSRKAIKQALDAGQIFVDGQVAKRASQLLSGGETLRLTLSGLAAMSPPPEPAVLLLDEALLALNKPAGMPSHPTGSGRLDALSWATRWLREHQGQETDPILLHRLDADTSGVLLLARSAAANRCLARRFAEREMDKSYLALVVGSPPGAFAVDNFLRAGKRGRTEVVHSGGQRAQTGFITLGQGPGFALVEALPKTGRTHQIRVHLAGSGYPLLGDGLYAGPATLAGDLEGLVFRRQLLHARRLQFPHPSEERLVTVEAPLAEDFLPLIQLLPSPLHSLR